jgi:hypothetical protein
MFRAAEDFVDRRSISTAPAGFIYQRKLAGLPGIALLWMTLS